MPELTGRTVLLAGATSASGRAAARTLLARGARVVATGRSAEKLEPLAALGAETEVLDPTDEAAVRALVRRLHERGLTVDGLLHLVGGWRGGGGLAGQTEEDYRTLEASFTALRHLSRALDDDLRASPAGRLAIVSSTAVARPLAGGANYAAVKAAGEAWTRAVAQGWAKAAREAGEPLRAAAVVLRVKTLAGLEERLAEAYAELWAADPAELNDSILTIQEKGTD
ncbi:alcohol dehydrogenase [Kocuria flava]|uniref:Alcohol dehydrogenase n=1 Tax=Kocuria flava TaxID=446860 RepID=A0A2N4T087_9MICC|nr:SDR family oxidoreductase [Kocuria flava]PLC11647.1 alcohol dehydrogenase [Kocuria flava]